jgi:hypothetical protein
LELHEMAAVDTFDSYIATLSLEAQGRALEFIREQREEMLAARSEEARIRIAMSS